MLKLDKRPSGIWRIRGTHHGITINRSARTRAKDEATTILKAIERDIFIEVYGLKDKTTEKKPTFAEAALSYMQSGHGKSYDIERVLMAMGDPALEDITQGVIDRAAITHFPDMKNSSRLRVFYAPVGAILTHAQGERMMPAFRIKRPRPGQGRTDWRTPAEIETLIQCARGAAGLITFLVSTGCRISEACRLEWRDVSPDNRFVTFTQTKNSDTRTVELCARAKIMMPPRRSRNDRVFTKDDGQPWAEGKNGAFTGPALKFIRICRANGLPETRPHILRHTAASWYYSETKDTLKLMQRGGWRQLSMVQRYTHIGTDDLAEQVLEFGWLNFHKSGQYLVNKKG